MRLQDVLNTLEALDEAYDRIVKEHDESHAGAIAPSWVSIVRQRPLRDPAIATGDLRCARHSGAAHGIAHDWLTDQLASEMSEWVRLARWSGTARALLGIAQLDPAPSMRVGAAVYLDETRDFRVRFASTGEVLTLAPAEPRLWAESLLGETSYRPTHDLGQPHLFYSYAGGGARRWSFSDVHKGVEEYLASQGRRGDDAALSMLSTSPMAKLLGALRDSGRRHGVDRVPLSLSEAWLFGGPDEEPGELTEPDEACRFGLSPWMEGPEEALARLTGGEPPRSAAGGEPPRSAPGWPRRAAADLGYVKAAAEWAERIRGRKEPAKKVAAPPPAPGIAVGVILDKHASAQVGADGSAPTAPGAAEGVILDKDAPFAPPPAPGTAQGVILDKDAPLAPGTAQGVILDRHAPLAPGAAQGVILDKHTPLAPGAAQGVILDKHAPAAPPPAPGAAQGVILDKHAPAQAGAAGSPPAAPPPADGFGPHAKTISGALPEAELPEQPESDVTGRGRYSARSRPAQDGPAPAGAAVGARRERAQVRLESADFPCDDISIRELSGREAIGQLFSFQVDIVCFDDGGLDTERMLGADVALVFERGRDEVRRVHGMVAEVHDRLETESEWRSYRVWIVPRVWRSTLVETQEVYLDTSVPDLIQQKLSLVGLSGSDVQMRLRGSYPERELIVQYKETDVAFFSRLAEHLGVSFFFEHDGADQIVFCDDNSGFRPLPGAEVLNFRPRGDKVDVFEIEARSRAFPASFAMQDYNYRTPTVDLTGVHEAADGFGGGVVEYGAHHKTPAEGVALAKVRAEERHVANRCYVGESDVAEMAAGGRFTLSGHPRLDGMELLVIEVEHHAKQTVKMSGGSGADDAYRATFRAVDARRPYRPPRVTPRPRIHGVLTALVEPLPAGEIGESARIDTDGRYTVKFYFDAGDVAGRPKNSRPVRMIQPHAGPGYGVHFPLKPGVEVLLVFMDGDPDRPLILGAVPNPITPSPVVEEVSLMNRIETASGLIIEMRDAVPPLAK